VRRGKPDAQTPAAILLRGGGVYLPRSDARGLRGERVVRPLPVTSSHGDPVALDTETRLFVPFARAAPPRPPLVLVADDQEWSARAFESVLAPAGFAVLRCAGAGQVLEQLRFVAPDLLLVKDDLPGGGAALVEQLRREGRLPAGTPLFLAAATPLHRAERLALLRAGAWDVIHLPLDAEELVLKLGTLSRAKFECDRVREESLLGRVRELGHLAQRHPGPVACAVLAPEPDWEAGGQSEPAEGQVERLARRVARAARRSDVVGRVSQTEFAVVAPGTSTVEGLLLARRLVADAATDEEGRPPLRVRVGCCGVDDFGEVAMDPVELLVRATMALRRAQRDPREPVVCLFDSSVGMG
jgi:two-component system cell cycle response regulator